MGCIIAFFSLSIPRITIIFLLVLTNWMGTAYQTFVWPFLGFLFMPIMTIAYMGAMLHGGLTGWWLVLFLLAVVADLFKHGWFGIKILNRLSRY